MRHHQGKIVRIFHESEWQYTQIRCQNAAIPRAGQFVSAWTADQENNIFTTPLFPSEILDDGFITGSLTPTTWKPGTCLILRNPSGNGFNSLERIQRVLLIAINESTYRLHPIIHVAIKTGIDVALFTNCTTYNLPPQVETYPVNEVRNALEWADLILIDAAANELDQLGSILDIQHRSRPPCQTQILINTEMPCGGIADCAVCAVKTKQGWKLGCKDGPVFNLEEIEW